MFYTKTPFNWQNDSAQTTKKKGVTLREIKRINTFEITHCFMYRTVKYEIHTYMLFFPDVVYINVVFMRI